MSERQRYFAPYFYRYQPNASCDACNWLSLGLFSTREGAEKMAQLHNIRTGDAVKIGTAYDYPGMAED